MEENLSREIARLVHDLPVTLSHQFANLIQQHPIADEFRLRTLIQSTFPQPTVRQRLEEFLHCCAYSDDWTAVGVALAIETACVVEERNRAEERIEVVWTGPTTFNIPVRRTEQVLLELIDSSHHELHIVSFAVYRAESIKEAIARAAERGVTVALYIETWDVREQKARLNAIASLGEAVLKSARVYEWPLEHRLLAEGGGMGALHAKLAVADAHSMFVTSANLTEHALTLNIETGLLVHGGDAPHSVTALLTRLVAEGIFRQM